MVNNSSEKYISVLQGLFGEDFYDAYKEAPQKMRKSILPYLCSVHRRWYYSTMVEGSMLSPANFTENILDYFSSEQDVYPVPKPKSEKKMTGLSFDMVRYSLEDHPAARDMRTIIEYSSPSICVVETGTFSYDQAIEVSKLLTLNCPSYASYLFELAILLNFMKKTPSVHAMVVKPSGSWVKKPPTNKELISQIIEGTVKLSSLGLKMFAAFPEHLFTESFVRKAVSEPADTDDIFQKIFQVMGYDLNDLVEAQERMFDAPPDESFSFDMEMLSATYILGIAADKYIFTPFGYYLRLIKPFYTMSYDVYDDIDSFIDIADDPEESSVAFFAPCSSYTLTRMGLEYFGQKPTEQNFFDASVLPFKDIIDSAFIETDALRAFIEVAGHFMEWALEDGLPEDIYTFRVRLASDKARWVHLQVSGDLTFHDIYKNTTKLFDFKDNDDYSFFHDKEENRFAEYPSLKRAGKKSNRENATTAVNALDFQDNPHMIMVLFNQSAPFSGISPKVRFEIELMKITEAKDRGSLINVSRASKVMKDRLESET